jgi:Domain of unknown function (DUF222)
MTNVSSATRLSEAIDEIHRLELDTLSDAELEELAIDVHRQLSRHLAEEARLLAAVAARRSWTADGSKSCAAWLARTTNGCRSTAAAALRLGEALEAMPLVAAALESGDVTVQHTRVFASCRRFRPDAFAEAEATLLKYALTLPFQHFVIACARWREVVDPDGAEDRAAKLYDRRHLLFHRRRDGSLEFQSGLLDPVAADAFLDELRTIERSLFTDDWAEARSRTEPGDANLAPLRRSHAQRWADALVEMAHRSRTAPKDGKRPAPLVTVYVDYETVAGRLCELASGVPITPGQLLPLLTQADIERVVFGPRNRVIEVGVRQRFFTGGLRRAIELRDRHCQFPGCTEPAARCEVDHEIDYAEGGETTQENGRLYCGTHNRNKRTYESAGDVDEIAADEPQSDEELDRHARRCRARVHLLVEHSKRKRDALLHRALARPPTELG